MRKDTFLKREGCIEREVTKLQGGVLKESVRKRGDASLKSNADSDFGKIRKKRT